MTIIISDTHITNVYDDRKFGFLQSLFFMADKIIINGDFLDMNLGSTKDVEHSRWMKLLQLIQNKDTVIVLGNHDASIEKFYSRYSKTVLDQYDYELAGHKFKIMHGHQIVPNLTEKYQFLKHFPLIFIFGKYRNMISWMLFKMRGQLRYRKLNDKMKQWKASHLGKEDYLVTSHTHLPEYDKADRYLNTGFIDYGFASYVKIDNEKISLLQTTY